MIARNEVPTYREHYYVIDQYGQVLCLSDKRMLERQKAWPPDWGTGLHQTFESLRVNRVIERWVARFCRRNDLLQVGEIQLWTGRDPLRKSQHTDLKWKVMAVARDRRVDYAYPVGTKAPAPRENGQLLRVLARD